METRHNNLQTLKTLYEMMERSIFICQHNLYMELDRDGEDLFLMLFYQSYLNTVIPYSLMTHLDRDESEVVDYLKRRTKCVYDIDGVVMTEYDTEQMSKNNLSDSDNAEALMNALVIRQERQDSYNSKFSVSVKDGYREKLEQLIDQVIWNTEETVNMIEDHWSQTTMEAFSVQTNQQRQYSKNSWRSENPSETLNLLLTLENKA